jgi:hypothetical protein
LSAAASEKSIKPINTFCGQNAGCSNIKAGGEHNGKVVPMLNLIKHDVIKAYWEV